MKINLPYASPNHLPSLKTVVEGFRKIDSINFEGTSYEERKKILFDNLPTLPLILSPDGDVHFTTYRVRILEQSDNIKSQETFSHPPAINCTKTERAHLAGYPVLYTSLSPASAMREIKNLQPGQTFYLSKWVVPKDAKLIYAQFLYGPDIEIGDNISFLNKSNIEKMVQISSVYPEDISKAFMYLTQKLSSYFLSEDYFRSSFLAHHALYDHKPEFVAKPQALVYPSVAAGLDNINVAYHPDFVRDHLKMEWVYKLVFKGFEDDGASISLRGIGLNDSSGVIHWIFPFVKPEKTRITSAGVRYDSKPRNYVINPSNDIFIRNGNEFKLADLINNILFEDYDKLMPLLLDIDFEIDFSKIYMRGIKIKPDQSEVIYTIIDGSQYNITEIEVTLEYKFVGESLEEKNVWFEMETEVK